MKKRMMGRRMGALFVAGVLFSLSALVEPAFASDSQEPQVVIGGSFSIEYNSIAQMVEQNLDVQKAKTTVSSTFAVEHDYYKKLADAEKAFSDAEQSYRENKDKLYEQMEASIAGGAEESDARAAYDEQVASLDEGWNTQAESLRDNITTIRRGINTLQYSKQSASLAVVSTKQGQISNAQEAFLNYYSLTAKKAAAENKLSNLKWQISMAKVKLERKIISQLTYDTLVDSVPEVKLAVENYDTTIKQNELQLKSFLGLSASTPIKYGTLPDMKLIDEIPKRSAEADRSVYLGRSSVIEDARIGIGKAQSEVDSEKSDSYFGVNTATISYEQAVETATKDFEKAYGNLQDSYKAYKNAIKAHNVLEGEYTRLNKKYKNGQASKNTLRSKKDEIKQSEHNLKAQKIELYALYQNYVNGLTL